MDVYRFHDFRDFTEESFRRFSRNGMMQKVNKIRKSLKITPYFFGYHRSMIKRNAVRVAQKHQLKKLFLHLQNLFIFELVITSMVKNCKTVLY